MQEGLIPFSDTISAQPLSCAEANSKSMFDPADVLLSSANVDVFTKAHAQARRSNVLIDDERAHGKSPLGRPTMRLGR
jgi:hypothetical protein